MNSLYWIGGVSAVLLGVAVAAAPGDKMAKTDTDGNGSVSKTEAMAAADARFAKLDANSDGVVNAADRAAKMKARFAAIDTDSNGSISEAEFSAAHDAGLQKLAQARGGEGRRGRGDHGGGHDMGGKHTGGAHMGGALGGRGLAMLALADADKNQSVTLEEFRAAYASNFAKADTNNDGAISADERKAMREAMRAKWRSAQ